MNKSNKVVVAGLGEVGGPLLELVTRHYCAIGVDISPPKEQIGSVDVLHVCFPYQINNFVEETTRYISLFKPSLTIINSTVAVGTTRDVAERTGARVVNSPIRGKHARMFDDLCKYTKFVGGTTISAGKEAADHFASLGLKTKILSSPEATELAKLSETTYFGLMIAWAQEIEYYCDQTATSYDEIVSFYEEIPFFPGVKYIPGIIGGHCVMPNIELLRRLDSSGLLQAIKASNGRKIERDSRNATQEMVPSTLAITS